MGLRAVCVALLLTCALGCVTAQQATLDPRFGSTPSQSVVPPQAPAAPPSSCIAALNASQYTQFAALIAQAQLTPGLQDAIYNFESPLTIFAPTNEAVTAVIGSAAALYLSKPENMDDLQTLILAHVVGQSLGGSDLTSNLQVLSLVGDPLAFSGAATSLRIESANISGLAPTLTPISGVNKLNTSECIVHEISGVLIPTTLSSPALLAGLTPTMSARAPAPAPALAPAPAPARAVATTPPVTTQPAAVNTPSETAAAPTTVTPASGGMSVSISTGYLATVAAAVLLSSYLL